MVESRAEKRERHFRVLSAGMTREQFEQFYQTESQRVKEGKPRLDELDLPFRLYGLLKRSRVQTVDGLKELLAEGRRSYQVGPKGLSRIQAALQSYEEQHREI